MKDLPENASYLDYFELFNAELMDIIVTQTNEFYNFCGDVDAAAMFPLVRHCRDTDIGEMHVFLSLTMLMPVVTKQAIKEYWDKDSLTYLPVFGKYMARDRYQLILQFLHFCDNCNIDRGDYVQNPVSD